MRSLKYRRFKEKLFKFISLFVVFMVGVLIAFLFYKVSVGSFRAIFPYSVELRYCGDKALEGPKLDRKIVNNSLNILAKEIGANSAEELFFLAPEGLTHHMSGFVNKDSTYNMPLSEEANYYFSNAYRQNLTDQEIAYLTKLKSLGYVHKHFNKYLFSKGDSGFPMFAGMKGAIVGTMYIVLIGFTLVFFVGLGSAIYLSEYLNNNNWLYMILEANIANLASVPSIVYGLLGFMVFIVLLGMPMSSPIVGGLTLSIMSLPTMILIAKNAIAAVPRNIRESAYSLGLFKHQVVFHHVVPYALPGIITASLASMVRIIGETAPLLMIGMVAFIIDVPKSPSDASIAMPVQVLLWSDMPGYAYQDRAYAIIFVILLSILIINIIAMYFRSIMERKNNGR